MLHYFPGDENPILYFFLTQSIDMQFILWNIFVMLYHIEWKSSSCILGHKSEHAPLNLLLTKHTFNSADHFKATCL